MKEYLTVCAVHREASDQLCQLARDGWEVHTAHAVPAEPEGATWYILLAREAPGFPPETMRDLDSVEGAGPGALVHKQEL